MSKTLEKFLDITKLNGPLENIYNTLAELEINGQFGSEEYQQNIEHIQLIVEFIDKKLNNLHATEEELMSANDLIGDLNHLNKQHDILVDILDLETNNKMRRLCMQIYYYALKHGSYVIEDVYFDEDFADAQDEIDQLTEESLIREDQIEYLKERLIANTFMDYLLEEIKNQKNKAIRNELIKVKYRIIYLYEHLEAAFLKDQQHFTKTSLIQDLLSIEVGNNDCDLEELYIEPVDQTTKDEIDYLSSLNDEFFKSRKNIVRAILRSIYIKTYLSINISTKSFQNLINYRSTITPNSQKGKKYIDDSYVLSKEASNLKKVDF